MFKHLARLQQAQSIHEHVSIEGYFDELKKLFGEKKNDPEKNRRYVKESDELCARIMRTYGNSAWVHRTGCVNLQSISGNNIACYLEIDGVIPKDLDSAVHTHITTVNAITQQWNTKINTYHVALIDAFKSSTKCKTIAEQAKFIDAALKHVNPPDLTEGLSLIGLMGSVFIKDNRLMYADSQNDVTLPPLSEMAIPQIAKLTCLLVKQKFADATKDLVSPPHEYLTEYGVGGTFDSEASLYVTIENHYPHVISLIRYDVNYLDLYDSMTTSAFNISQALERWMHRSVK